MDDPDPIFVTIVVNLALSSMVLFFYVLIAQPPDDSVPPLVVRPGKESALYYETDHAV